MGVNQSNLSFNDYYDRSPEVLIRDDDENLYSFPKNKYDNPEKNVTSINSDNFTKGKSYYSINANDWVDGVWKDTKKIDPTNYTNVIGGTVSYNESANANDITSVNKLNGRPTPPGYIKQSGGKADDESSFGWIIAEVDNGMDNYSFAVYTKMENRKDFFNALYSAAPDDKKKILRQMAAKDCSNGNQRWNNNGTAVGTDFCDVVCDGSADTKDSCYDGTVQWCKDDVNKRVKKSFNPLFGSPNTHEKCITPLKEGKFDDNISGWCESKNIDSVFCDDIRKNLGSDNIKKELNRYLYGEYCNLDVNINQAGCTDVRNTCDDTAQLLTDIDPFNCRTLVKSLNEEPNIIKMTSKMDLSKVPVNKRMEMLEFFNKRGSNLVEDALCSITGNASDAACQAYLNNNFSNLVKTDALKPILIMYFNGGISFNTKAGMDSWDSFKIKFRSGVDNKVGLTSPKITLGSEWSAKLYTYITPSTTLDYVFKLTTSDSAKVYLNNNLIINAWNNISAVNTQYSTYITLDPNRGPYLLYVEYADADGASDMNLEYTTRTAIGTKARDDSSITYSSFAALPVGVPLSGVSPLTGNGIVNNTLYMSSFNPYVLVSSSKRTQSIKYCSTNERFAKDDNCRGTRSNNYKAINSTYVTSDDTFKKSMIDYCAKDNNFSTDVFCIGDVELSDDYSNGINKNPIIYDSSNKSINTAIENFCKVEKNNTYSTTNKQWCKNIDNLNNAHYKRPLLQSLHPTYAKTLRETRLKYIQDAINTSINTGGLLSQDIIDYITTDYLILQANAGANLYPDSNIVTPEVTSFCENSDSGLKTNLCNNVYSTYKNNSTVSSSQARINDYANCIATNAFMGKSTIPNDPYNATCVAKRDAPATYARYLPLAIQYCGTGDNIVSPECTSYYNNIQSNINNAMNANYTNAVNNPVKSSFSKILSNRESFNGNNCEDGYYEDESESENSDYPDCSYLFILFICFVLVLCCFSSYSKSYSKCKKNKHHQEQMQFQAPTQAQK